MAAPSYSTALRNFIGQKGSWREALNNGHLEIYSTGRPASADLAPAGNLLLKITKASGSKTNEVCATGVVTLTGGTTTGDNVTAMTLAGRDILGATVLWNTSLTQTAADICTQINRNCKNKFVVATSSSGVITLTALPGIGVDLNASTLAGTGAASMTVTITSTTFGSGTGGSVAGVAAVNGLGMDLDVAGVFTKNPSEVWSGVVTGAGTQTAAWGRYIGAVADDASDDSTTKKFIRIDFDIATSGATMNIANTSMVNGATRTINDFSLTVPAA